jgi:hypothetical protein
MAATIFVCDAVYGGISIYSMHLALYLAFSILWFWAASISRRSTGAGGSSGVAWSVFVVPSPRSLRILDMCGSFLDLAAEPRINTNFYSSSYASYWSLVSLACSSTLLECGPFCLALTSFIKRSSYSWYFLSHLSSIASMVSEFTRTCYGRWAC